METLSDIVAEMRRNGDAWCEDKSTNKTECLGLITLKYADRIEAAWKREKAEIEADALAVGGLVEAERRRVVVSKTETTTVGNAAAMRDAVVKALTLLNVCDWPSGVSLDGVGEVIHEIDSVLDKPPRQCDMGTPDEQAKRFHDFCAGNSGGINGMCKPTCPCIDCFDKCQCFAKWAQTPYVEEGEGE